MAPPTSSLRVLGFVLLVVSLTLAAACGGDDGKTGVEFGSGSLPETVPADFPVPEEAVINGTLIDWDRDRTEINMIFPAAMSASARFYDENLPNLGYVVESSAGSQESWTISFTKDRLTGDIGFRPQTETSTTVTIEFINPEP